MYCFWDTLEPITLYTNVRLLNHTVKMVRPEVALSLDFSQKRVEVLFYESVVVEKVFIAEVVVLMAINWTSSIASSLVALRV